MPGAAAPNAETAVMTLSILLTRPWDVRVDTMPHTLDVPRVAPHRFSWKHAGTVGHPRGPWQVFPQRPDTSDNGGTSDEAEVIAAGTDEELFAILHGVLARDADYDAVAAASADTTVTPASSTRCARSAHNIPMRCGWCTRGGSKASLSDGPSRLVPTAYRRHAQRSRPLR